MSKYFCCIQPLFGLRLIALWNCSEKDQIFLQETNIICFTYFLPETEFSTSQEIPRILWSPNVFYHVTTIIF